MYKDNKVLRMNLRAPRSGIPYQRRMLDSNGTFAQTYYYGMHTPRKTAGIEGTRLIYALATSK
jgi:hypothetical protein